MEWTGKIDGENLSAAWKLEATAWGPEARIIDHPKIGKSVEIVAHFEAIATIRAQPKTRAGENVVFGLSNILLQSTSIRMDYSDGATKTTYQRRPKSNLRDGPSLQLEFPYSSRYKTVQQENPMRLTYIDDPIVVIPVVDGDMPLTSISGTSDYILFLLVHDEEDTDALVAVSWGVSWESEIDMQKAKVTPLGKCGIGQVSVDQIAILNTVPEDKLANDERCHKLVTTTQ